MLQQHHRGAGAREPLEREDVAVGGRRVVLLQRLGWREVAVRVRAFACAGLGVRVASVRTTGGESWLRYLRNVVSKRIGGGGVVALFVPADATRIAPNTSNIPSGPMSTRAMPLPRICVL